MEPAVIPPTGLTDFEGRKPNPKPLTVYIICWKHIKLLHTMRWKSKICTSFSTNIHKYVRMQGEADGFVFSSILYGSDYYDSQATVNGSADVQKIKGNGSSLQPADAKLTIHQSLSYTNHYRMKQQHASSLEPADV